MIGNRSCFSCSGVCVFTCKYFNNCSFKSWNHLVQHKRQHRTKVLLKSFHLNWSDIRIASIDSKGSSNLHNIIHPASRALLLLLGGERETLRKSCRFFEVAAVQISGLVILVLCRQTGFTAHASVFVGKPKVKTEPTVGREKKKWRPSLRLRKVC